MTFFNGSLAAALLAAFAAAVLTPPAVAAPKKGGAAARVEIVGQVSRVVDGDTLWVKTEGDGEPPVVVRLEGIDAPESCQLGGADATAALTALALGRNVVVRVAARDDHGRTVGKVYDGEKDLGDRMVRDGQAWSSRYQYDRGPYMSEERMALALRRGLHGAGNAVLPRDFRKQHGPCENASAKLPAAGVPLAAVSANTTAVAAPSKLPRSARCDGRIYCSQMSSCAEATWFLKNCSGVKMDGDRDGVPCEQQWCGVGR
ncbi:MAG: thermonuclease family protein [Burkholderiaceae bacterium]